MTSFAKLPARTRNLVYLLVGLLAIGLWQTRERWLGSDGLAAVLGAPTARPTTNAAIPDEIVGLRLADLDKQSGSFELGRDPFRYGEKPAPPVVYTPPPPPPVVVAPPPVPCPPNCPVPPKPQPPPVTFTYVGNFGSPGRMVAVLRDGKEVFNALEGDVLKDQFLIAKIGLESVEVRFVNFPDAAPRRLAIGTKSG